MPDALAALGDCFALCSVGVLDTARGQVRGDHAVVVEHGRIAAVVPMSRYRRSRAHAEVELPGHTVMPGLIDAHVHLTGARATVDDQEHGAALEPPLLRAMRSVHDAQSLLRRGVTAVRDISWNGLYLKRLFASGLMPGPKVIACGPGLTRTGGHADLYQMTADYARSHAPWGFAADGPDEVVKAVRTFLREGADAIKVFVSGGDNWPHDRLHDVHYSREELQACVEEAHRQQGTVVAAHAETREAIKLALDVGCDTIEHGEDLDADLVAAMVDKGTILVPTLELIVNWYRDFMPGDQGDRRAVRPDAFLYRDHYQPDNDAAVRAYTRQCVTSFRLALEAGVEIALGSDTVYEPLTPYGEYSLRELRALVQYGMSPPEALRAATRTSARAIGMGHLLGSVEVGMLADLLAVRGDPTTDVAVLEVPRNITATFCDGRLAARQGRLTA